MRFHFISIGLLLAVSVNGQDYGQDYLRNYLTNKTRTDSEGTQILDAPIFGTPDYFKTHFARSKPIPQFELTGPSRLADFVVDGHLELSLSDYLELVMANNTSINDIPLLCLRDDLNGNCMAGIFMSAGPHFQLG